MEFDKEKTESGYLQFELDPISQTEWDQVKSRLPSIIQELVSKKSIDFVGINFDKPFELLEIDNKLFIEYLFVGKLKDKNQLFIDDDDFAINIFLEDRFGENIFGTDNLLNLTITLNSV